MEKITVETISNVFGLQQEGVECGQSVWSLMELEQ
jgi:hypothetical protein